MEYLHENSLAETKEYNINFNKFFASFTEMLENCLTDTDFFFEKVEIIKNFDLSCFYYYP